MRILSFGQKPYDLLAVLEYLRHAGLDRRDLTVAIVGNHANARALRALCEREGLRHDSAADPDLYAVAVARLHARWIAWRRTLLPVKALLRLAAWLWWFIAARSARRWWRDRRADLVLSDCWRSKAIYWLARPAGARLVLHDGGFSTLSYALLPAFAQDGAPGLVRRALGQQRPLMPRALRRQIGSCVDQTTPFFTCYVGTTSGAPTYPLLANTYDLSRQLFQNKVVLPKATIMGIPRTKHIDDYLSHTLAVMETLGLPADPGLIDYRFHPTDKNRSQLDARYRQTNEASVTDRGMSFSYPAFSMEFDLLDLSDLPALIVCYESSSLVWMRQMLAGITRIEVLAAR
jgi:hypothetical protein